MRIETTNINNKHQVTGKGQISVKI